MKIIIRIIVSFLLLLIGLWLVQMIAAESGEVVVLHTMEKSGGEFTTRLWVVDHEGDVWLRAGSKNSSWLKRMEILPEIIIERKSDQRSMVATIEPEYKDKINLLMQEKYAWRDSYISLFANREESVPVRLKIE